MMETVPAKNPRPYIKAAKSKAKPRSQSHSQTQSQTQVVGRKKTTCKSSTTKTTPKTVAKIELHDQKPLQQQLVRQRRSGLKVPYSHTRFGCKVCKIRKIRCDETHPSCQNCVRSGRKCDGIPQSDHSLRFAAPVTLSHFWPAQSRKLGETDVAFLDLFRLHLIDGIVGDASSPAWKRLILQAVHEESVLCHAAVALSALHEIPSENDGTGVDDATPSMSLMTSTAPSKRLALRHYNQCIKGLQDVLNRSDRSPNVILLCILLCFCFELRMHDTGLSQNHLEHGLRILQSNPASVDEDLAMAFTKLDVQSSVHQGRRAPVLDVKRWTGPIRTAEGLGYQQAHKDLTCLLNGLIGFLHTEAHVYRYEYVEPAPLHVHVRAEELGDDLERFRRCYLPPESPYTPEAVNQPPMQRILWVKYLMARTLLTSCLALEECAYDLLLPDFTTIIVFAESLVQAATNTVRRHNKFSLNMGIIFPLFKIAQKCRSPDIRRRAMALLSNIRCSEGPWEGTLCQKYAERAMQLEEAGLDLDMTRIKEIPPSVVPEWQRIHILEVQPFYNERYSVLTFRRRLNGLDGEWDDLVEVVKW